MSGRRLLMSALLVVAAYLAFFGDKTPADVVEPTSARGAAHSSMGAAAPVAVASRLAALNTPAGKRTATLEVAALIPRDTLIPVAGDARAARDLFPALSWTPPPIASPPAKPLPPVAPPLPFVFLGKKYEGGQWEAYLGLDDDVFIVREGMTLDGIYLIKSINPPMLTLLYTPLKQSQTISIGGAQ